MKYYFWILGCAMNYSDAERMATILDSLGYTKTDVEREADLFIVISCSVRESAMLRIYGKVKELIEYKRNNTKFKTILTGCVLEKDQKKLKRVFDILMTMEDLPKLPEMLKNATPSPSSSLVANPGISLDPSDLSSVDLVKMGVNPNLRKDDSGEYENYLSIIPKYQSHFRAYVPISTGCDNFCSYCAVPYTKGREKSRPSAEIVSEIKNLVDNGFKEITLLGQNVNSYGHDISGNKRDNSPFIHLLLELDTIAGDHRIYFYSNHPKDMTDELIVTLAKLKHFPHYIHLPLQSGNNEILRNMNRHNTREEYLQLVKKIKNAIPDVNLTTDIIVGYPGETEKQFNDTADVMQQAEYDMAFIAQYSPRPGTVSAKQEDDATKEEKVRREKVLQKIVAGTVLEHNRKLVGTTQKILIDEQKGNKYFGRTEGYKVVEIETDQPLKIGQYIKAVIKSTTSWKLIGKI